MSDDDVKTVLIPLPDNDFDVTETAVPWKKLREAHINVVFATQNGTVAACDPLLLTGVMFGKLGAEEDAKAMYAEMIETDSFKNPLAWTTPLLADEFDAILLPGGHAKGVKQLLECEVLRAFLFEFWQLRRPVAAICHGTIALARCVDTEGKSVLHDRRTTCLPFYMERTAYFLTAWRLGTYYRTYPEYVETEVRSVLDDADAQFDQGPRNLLGKRGTADDDSLAFVVRDGRYLSARWPGDAFLFAKTFIEMLQ